MDNVTVSYSVGVSVAIIEGKKPLEKIFHRKTCNEEVIIPNILKKNPLFQNIKNTWAVQLNTSHFKKSLWLKERKFQAVVKNSDVCCSCLLCGSEAGWEFSPMCAGCCPGWFRQPPPPSHDTDTLQTWPCQPWRGSSVPQPRSPWSQHQGSAAAGTHSTGKGAARSAVADPPPGSTSHESTSAADKSQGTALRENSLQLN